MKFINSLSILLFIFILSACTDDLIFRDHNGEFEEGPLVEAYLSLSVNNYTISSAGTRAAEPSETPEIATDAEKRIDNIWVFQYDAATGQQLIKPVYYEITDQETLKNLKVLLKEDIESNICIVANTKDSNWAIGKDLSTTDKLKAMTLSNPDPILLADLNNPILSSRRSIPMEGTSGNVAVSSGSTIEVGVQRMYAKIKISFDKLIDGMSPKSIEVSSIPRYCKVESLGINLAEEDKAIYNEEDNYWVVRTFNSGNKDSEYVIYVPENLQGETDNYEEGLKGEDAPVRALAVDLIMKYETPEEGSSELSYCVYPGGNDTNNFNIRRNSVYRVKIKINSASEEANTPSSNCFVVIPGETLTFEPYHRKEIGGGYKIEDYLNPEVEELRIDKVDIVWQTMEAIGDNSAGNLVKYNEDRKKISVKTNKEGNALVAAYNSAGDIIWSWHIWITRNDPGNIGNAVVYTTYEWDSKGIKWNQPRVEGYAVMPCNLGALANAPEDMGNADTPDSWYCQNLRTYGTIYQWGRKDPFPPIKFYNKNTGSNKNSGYNGYNAHQANIELYDNSHNRIAMTIPDGTPTPDKNELFNAISTTDIGSTKQAGLKYVINNPTMFVTAASMFSGNNYNSASKYVNRGDWLPEGDPCLWGGYPTEGHEKFSPYPDRAIWRNYGSKKEDKTIFDPCPKGWRVPPGDLWLGFTNEGINFGAYDQEHLDKRINCPTNYTADYFKGNNGFWLCLDGWKTEDPSKHSFFPTQGSRLSSGQCYLAGVCGNYHNATVDAQVKVDGVPIDRVNILHLHTDRDAKINTFEDQLLYYNKAVAGPIRCVRDRKN